jgi:hypothetical protein
MPRITIVDMHNRLRQLFPNETGKLPNFKQRVDIVYTRGKGELIWGGSGIDTGGVMVRAGFWPGSKSMMRLSQSTWRCAGWEASMYRSAWEAHHQGFDGARIELLEQFRFADPIGWRRRGHEKGPPRSLRWRKDENVS